VLGGGRLPKACDGDIIKLCGHEGLLQVNADLDSREPVAAPSPHIGTGRELFAFMRHGADNAEHGGSAMLAGMDGVL